MSSTQPQGCAVLVVEDEPLVRADLAEELRLLGLKVFEAASGDEALQLLDSIHNISLIITDIRMPGQMDGLGLARWVRRERPTVKIVLATGNFIADLGSSADAIFSKPYCAAEVAKRAVYLVNTAQGEDTTPADLPL